MAAGRRPLPPLQLPQHPADPHAAARRHRRHGLPGLAGPRPPGPQRRTVHQHPRPLHLQDQADNNGQTTTKTSTELGTARQVLRGFRLAHVFDLAQTDGDTVQPPAGPTLLEGEAPQGLWEALAAQVTHGRLRACPGRHPQRSQRHHQLHHPDRHRRRPPLTRPGRQDPRPRTRPLSPPRRHRIRPRLPRPSRSRSRIRRLHRLPQPPASPPPPTPSATSPAGPEATPKWSRPPPNGSSPAPVRSSTGPACYSRPTPRLRPG